MSVYIRYLQTGLNFVNLHETSSEKFNVFVGTYFGIYILKFILAYISLLLGGDT